MVKCPYCEEKVDKDESHEYKKRYYHPGCFRTWQRDGEDYKTLMAYISSLYRVDYPSMIIKKQIKDYKDEGYKYKGMELALRYFYETLDNRVQENTGVGIIPYVYEDAKKHYMKIKRINESYKNYSDEEITVYIKSDKQRRKPKQIDISNI
ncbi:hypothetical protein WKH57_01590 [Niallia taxi]|uniref:hypothetical protein n=1 Tax=Niallia taxi TaxID=2499688 RepID=UPI0031760E79